MATKEVKKAILDVYLKFASKDHWTQGNYALTEFGEPVFTDSKKAFCWCLTGAIDAVCGKTEFYQVCHELREDVGYMAPNVNANLVTFNDNSTYREVRSLLRKTMKRLGIDYRNAL